MKCKVTVEVEGEAKTGGVRGITISRAVQAAEAAALRMVRADRPNKVTEDSLEFGGELSAITIADLKRQGYEVEVYRHKGTVATVARK